MQINYIMYSYTCRENHRITLCLRHFSPFLESIKKKQVVPIYPIIHF